MAKPHGVRVEPASPARRPVLFLVLVLCVGLYLLSHNFSRRHWIPPNTDVGTGLLNLNLSHPFKTHYSALDSPYMEPNYLISLYQAAGFQSMEGPLNAEPVSDEMKEMDIGDSQELDDIFVPYTLTDAEIERFTPPVLDSSQLRSLATRTILYIGGVSTPYHIETLCAYFGSELEFRNTDSGTVTICQLPGIHLRLLHIPQTCILPPPSPLLPSFAATVRYNLKPSISKVLGQSFRKSHPDLIVLTSSCSSDDVAALRPPPLPSNLRMYANISGTIQFLGHRMSLDPAKVHLYAESIREAVHSVQLSFPNTPIAFSITPPALYPSAPPEDETAEQEDIRLGVTVRVHAMRNAEQRVCEEFDDLDIPGRQDKDDPFGTLLRCVDVGGMSSGYSDVFRVKSKEDESEMEYAFNPHGVLLFQHSLALLKRALEGRWWGWRVVDRFRFIS